MKKILPISISVSSTIDSQLILHKAQSLANKLKFPHRRTITDIDTELSLVYRDNGLQLVQILETGRLRRLLHVDFIKGKSGYRHNKNLTIRQPLAKAIGIKQGVRPSVLDATAGLGQDAFVLACLGCQVSMCERSPVLHSLLEDGLDRAAREEKTMEIVSNRMKLLYEDSKIYLHDAPRIFNTIYLDPMYPHRTSSALNKLEMRVIRDLVGDDEDSEMLLKLALSAAKNRVVVKRPKWAKELSDLNPSFVVPMKNSRYDIYLTTA